MSKISELTDGGSLLPTDFLIAVRSGANVKVQADQADFDRIRLGDNEKIELGNSQDLTLVHTATQSIINQAGIGDLLLQKAGATKLTINATGIDVTGTITADGLDLGDASVLNVGTIALDTIKGDADDNTNITFAGSDTTTFTQGGTQRLAVNTSGITVTGSVTADGLTTNGAAEGDTYFTGGTASSRLLNVFTSTHNGGANAGHNFKIASGQGAFIFGNNTTANLLTVESGGIDITGSVTADGGTIVSTGSDSFSAKAVGGYAIQAYQDATSADHTSLDLRTDNVGGDDRYLIRGYADASGTPTENFNVAASGKAYFASNVGIGTSSPATLIEASGSSTSTTTGISSPLGLTLRNTDTTDGNYTTIQNRDGNGDQNAEIKFINVSHAGNTGAIAFTTRSATGEFAEKVRISNTGNVGIGTDNPDYKLHIEATGDNLKLSRSGVGEFAMGVASGGSLAFEDKTAAEERMRIDSSGDVNVGCTDANSLYNNTGTNTGAGIRSGGQIQQAVYQDVVQYLNRTGNDGDIVNFRKDGVGVGSIGVSSSGDRVYFAGSGDSLCISASLNAIFSGTTAGSGTDNKIDIGTNSTRFKDLYLSGVMAAGNGSVAAPSVRGTDTNTGLFFPSGGVTAITRNGVEGCRMDANGNLLVGVSTFANNTLGVAIRGASTGATDESIRCAVPSTSSTLQIGFYNSNGRVGSISTSGSATAYNTSSDQRLKENIADADDAGSKIDAIQVRKFDWKADGSHQDYGMVAQELQSVAPEAVAEPQKTPKK